MTSSHFVARAYDAFTESKLPAAAFVKRVSAPADGCRVLDVGTGTGRILPHFRAFGWQVDALEPFVPFGAYAQWRYGIFVQQGGFEAITERDAYDVITALGSPLLYLPDGHSRQDAIDRLWQALKPGGCLIMEMWNMVWLLRHYTEPPPLTTTLDGHQVRLTRRHSFDDHHGTLTQHEDYTSTNGESGRLVHTIYVVTAHMVCDRMDAFDRVATYNTYTDRQPTHINGSRMIVVGYKPA